jgi:hypothetical protein
MTSLTFETDLEARVSRQDGCQELDCYLPLETLIPSSPHRGHSPGPELFEQFVAIGHRGHGRDDSCRRPIIVIVTARLNPNISVSIGWSYREAAFVISAL